MSAKPLTYFPTRKDDTIEDDFYGTIVKDPLRWLEDDRSPETIEFVTKQNELTQSFLSQIPFKSIVHKKLIDAWNYERHGSPFTEGNYIYWAKNDGLQNQAVYYRKHKDDIDNTTEEIFLDPNTWSEKGTSSLSQLEFTEDGSLAIVYISHAGSDVNVGRFYNTNDLSLKEDIELKDIKFSSASFYKNNGLFYSRYDFDKDKSVLTARTDSHRLYYHTIGTSQDNDVHIFGHKDTQKRRYVSGFASDDNKYLIISAAQATSGNELYIKVIHDENVANDNNIITMLDNCEYDFDPVDCVNDKLYLLTNWNAPNKRLIAIDLPKFIELSQQDTNNIITHFKNIPECITEIIPEDKDAVLDVSHAGSYFIAGYRRLALSEPKQYTYDGTKVRDITLPGVGTAVGFSSKRKENHCYFAFTSYISPATIYKYDLETGESTLHVAPKVNVDGLDRFVSKQVFYPSKDGTEVPMIITYDPTKVDLTNGTNPLMLYGYGGFNISLSPSFSIPVAIWVALGGIYAVPNIRGGGEKGKQWHEAGTKYQKQNVFDDFIAAAKWLIANNYTKSELLAIRGGSNGGLLVGACMTQEPSLFRVAIPMVGVLDMLRYHKSTAGEGWAEDYLHSGQGKEQFEYLYKYSPVHNVKENVAYPATLVTCANVDDRVVPSNSYKFAVNLQELSLNARKPEEYTKQPVLLRIDVDAGHGAGKSLTQLSLEHADIISFALFAMDRSVE